MVEDNLIIAVGDGPAGDDHQGRRVDGAGCLVTPGFVNTHHHLYQWVTRGFAVDGTLFEWLTTLYPVWAQLDADITRTRGHRRPGHAWPRPGARRRPITTTSSRTGRRWGRGPARRGDRRGAHGSGLRFHPTRGSMDLGQSKGGLPPDNVVEDIDNILAASEAAIDTYHDPSFGSMLRIALAPCSPFSVTGELLRRLGRPGPRARACGCTPICARRSTRRPTAGSTSTRTPVEYMESRGLARA